MATRPATVSPTLDASSADELLRHALAGAMATPTPDLAALRNAVWAYVVAARADGQMIERIIAAIKSRVRQLTPARAEGNQISGLLQHLVTWSIDEYYRGR